jgi:hypothetical protein
MVFVASLNVHSSLHSKCNLKYIWQCLFKNWYPSSRIVIQSNSASSLCCISGSCCKWYWNLFLVEGTCRLYPQGRRFRNWKSVLASKRRKLAFARVFFYSEDGSDTFLRNVGSYKTHKPHQRWRDFSYLPQWEPQILFIFSCLPSVIQKYQDSIFNPFLLIYHCVICEIEAVITQTSSENITKYENTDLATSNKLLIHKTILKPIWT